MRDRVGLLSTPGLRWNDTATIHTVVKTTRPVRDAGDREQKYTKLVNKLNKQPIRNAEAFPNVAILENGYCMQMRALI